jgi:hypothetical protein
MPCFEPIFGTIEYYDIVPNDSVRILDSFFYSKLLFMVKQINILSKDP